MTTEELPAATGAGPSRRLFLGGASGAAALVTLGGLLDRNTASAVTPTTPADTEPAAVAWRSVVAPIAITSVTGEVSNAAHLVNGGATATMKVKKGGTIPQVVVDYGRIVGGRPRFVIARVSGDVTLRSVYSQSLPYLLPAGDGPGPGTPTTTTGAEQDVSFVGAPSGANLSRTETYPVRAAGTILGHLLQAGERFQAISIQGHGSVEISTVGLLPSFRIDTPHDDKAGAFTCSDPLLTDIWGLGVHTINACSVPVGSVAPLWVPTAAGLKVFGSAYTGYWPGGKWTDYTMQFQIQILENEAAWLVRGGPTEQGIVCVLCAKDDTLPVSTPGTLRIYNQANLALVDTVDLPFTVTSHTWYSVSTAVSGTSLAVSINGHRVFTNAAVTGMSATGFPGFSNAEAAVALVRKLTVTDHDGTTLIAEPLTNAAAARFVDACVAGTNTTPSIMDGATRDRMAFTGDLGASSRTILCSSFDNIYVAGSVELFRRYQGPDGTITVALPAQANGPQATGPLGGVGGLFGVGTADYELSWANSISDYWLHTGDDAWLRKVWPSYRALIDLLVSQLAGNGLLEGFELIATETSTNAHFYGMLFAGSAMASHLGHRTIARSWTATAAKVRAAINSLLFNKSAGMYGSSPTQLDVYDQAGNGYALLYGVPDASIDITKLTSNLTTALAGLLGPASSSADAPDGNVGPYTTGSEILGRLQVGDSAAAVGLIRAVWGAMLEGSPYYSGGCWEYMDQKGVPGLAAGTSLAHGWSTGATPALSKYVLGARPLAAAYTTWLVEPQTADLSWATGQVPTPRGPLAVTWRTTANGAAGTTVTVDSPRESVGFIGVRTNSATVRLDGSHVSSIQVPGYTALPGFRYFGPVQPGAHQLVIAD